VSAMCRFIWKGYTINPQVVINGQPLDYLATTFIRLNIPNKLTGDKQIHDSRMFENRRYIRSPGSTTTVLRPDTDVRTPGRPQSSAHNKTNEIHVTSA
jgi:hypothetical protein